MKLFTFHTPSHKELCHRFVVSHADAAGFDECTVFESSQMCPSGVYNSDGFAETCWLKLDALAMIPVGTRALYVDADCLLLPGLAEWCSTWLDVHPECIGHGNDTNQYSMGVVLFTQSDSTIQWFRWIRLLAWMINLHDQTALNNILPNVKRVPVGIEHLPNWAFANWATGGDHSQEVWMGEPLHVPASTLCWHANFCKGVDEKMRMLEMVAGMVSAKMLDI